MIQFTTTNALDKELIPYRKNASVGFVPTMGALHEGHLSLVRKSLEENECTVVSIFVNPIQFDNSTDLEKYPRTLEADISLLNSLEGTIIIFAPKADEIYEDEIKSKKYNFEGLENEMEGKHRKGHFDGVGTVLNLLFRIVKPNKAYFGEKDFQQLQIVRKMVALENLPVKIVGCEIVRENSGLALSSRNERLSTTEKEAALVISKTLRKVKKEFKKQTLEQLNQMVSTSFKNQQLVTLEYFEIAEVASLKTALTIKEGNKYRAFIAAFVGGVRLIDNLAL